MATTTTIRVSRATRDLLNALSARRKTSAGETIAELVHAADDDLLLADAQADFERMARDRDRLAAYRAETDEIGDSFAATAPDW